MPDRLPDGPYAAIVESIPHLVWVAGPDGAIEYLNRKCLEYVGLPMGDLLGWDWRKVIHPDDLRRTVHLWQTALRECIPFRTEYRLRRHDGEYRWHVARAQPGPDGRWFGTCTDVHDHRRAEGLFRAVVERSYEGFALIGPDRVVRYASPAVTRILGYTPEEVVGRDLADLAHPDSRPGLVAWVAHLLARPGERVEVSYRFRHKAGDYRRLEFRATNLVEDPDVGGVVATFWDLDDPRSAFPRRAGANSEPTAT